MRKLLITSFALMIFSIIFILPGDCSSVKDYWPGDDWRTSTPEEQGMDSGKLEEMFRDIERNQIEIRSVLIIRHGYLVAECYRDPFNRDTGYNIKSVTKSFLSALTGIAIREKYIQSVDQKLSEFFPEYFKSDMDPRKKEITLRHLLTMTAGLQTTDDNTSKWAHSDDWLKYTVDLPVTAVPGKVFNYSTGLTHLVSALITKTSGISTLDFGRKYLFDPLGISVKKWVRDPRGVYIGGSELYITPRDMAKFGYLYLHNGLWNGRQVIPREWVTESVRNQQKSTPDNGYGYWWWTTQQDYQARGWGGQYIIVNPKLDLVIVFTAADFDKPLQYQQSFIYPAVISDSPLQPNSTAINELQRSITALANPKASPNAPSSKLLKTINGKPYHFEPNPWGLTTCALSFKGTDCTLKIEELEYQVPVGPEGKYRVSTMEGPPTYFGERPVLPLNEPGGADKYQIALRGQWLDDQTFLFEWLNYLGEPAKFTARFTFSGKKVEIRTVFLPIQWGGTFLLQGKQ